MTRYCLLPLPAGLPTVADEKPAPTFATFESASSVDGTKPLKADVGCVAHGKPKPLIVVMHGSSGSREAVTPDVKELAARGVFAVAPHMRGCGDSGESGTPAGWTSTTSPTPSWPRSRSTRRRSIPAT